jgi:hypothetical protein
MSSRPREGEGAPLEPESVGTASEKGDKPGVRRSVNLVYNCVLKLELRFMSYTEAAW